jgi:hypothetical protein
MLVRQTAKHRITLPAAIAKRFSDVDEFEVCEVDGRIVLTPVRPGSAAEVRSRIANLGITGGDVSDAVRWSRRSAK